MKQDHIEFQKYQKKGAYHWSDIRKHPTRRNAYVLGRYLNVIELLKRHLPGGLAGKNVLDLGCGDGALSYLLSLQGANVSGADLSDIGVALAQKKNREMGAHIHFRVESVYAVSWQDDSFDAVVSSDVIEHVADPEKMLHEIKRVLKPGGMAVVSTPIRITEDIASEHIIEWFPQEYQALLESHFPGSQYYQSHPAFWKELFEYSPMIRFWFNLYSLVQNPFVGFQSEFKLPTLQYSVSTLSPKNEGP